MSVGLKYNHILYYERHYSYQKELPWRVAIGCECQISYTHTVECPQYRETAGQRMSTLNTNETAQLAISMSCFDIYNKGK